MLRFNKLIILAIAALVLVACGGAAAEPVSLTIDMTEYAFTPPNLQLKVGQEVTLTLTNSGQLQHEIMFGRNVMMVSNRPAGYHEDMFEAGGVTPEVTQDVMPEEMVERHAGFMVVVPIGGTATMKFKVTEGMVGEWEMGCFEQDGVHYDAGMKGPVSVTK
jgi:plastocyanin